MVDCPNCGTEVAIAIKCWTVVPAKHTGNGHTSEFRVGIFKCPKCESKFRFKVSSIAKLGEKNIGALVAKIKEIRQGLMQSRRTLGEKMKTLETERGSLLVEIEKLKKVAESRVKALDMEVNQLRDELRFLRELLGVSEERV